MTKQQRGGVRTAASDFTALPQIEITQWVTVDEAALPPERLQQFRHRMRAITLYLDGANEAQLLHETGLKRRNVYRIVSSDACNSRMMERYRVGAAHCHF